MMMTARVGVGAVLSTFLLLGLTPISRAAPAEHPAAQAARSEHPSAASSSTAPGEGALTVTGALPHTGVLSLKDLGALSPEKASWDSRGQTHQVVGVPLSRILAHFGFTPGPMGKDVSKADKRAGYRKVVLATAADGYTAVFSSAEVAQDMGPTRALVIWEVDGMPVPPDTGPLRLVVLTDKEPSRSLHQLTRLELKAP